MKFRNFIAGCVLVFFAAPLFGENKPAMQAPAAFLPEQTYIFEPVVEGVEVSHDFVLQNKGTAALDIIKLESG